MNKEKLIHSILWWLQRFGDSDNETFYYSLNDWELYLQYDYDLEGDRFTPYNWCSSGFKHVHNNTLEDRTDEELREILNELLDIKQ
jgi:hypothetical protein